MNLHRHLRLVVTPTLAVAAIAVVGCGGSSSSSASGSSSSSSSRDAARVKFAQCLRENGVNVPDNPGQGGGAPQNIDRSKLQAAQKACQKFQQAAVGNISDEQRQEFQDAFAKFATCMRKQGVEVPNFTPGSGPPAGGNRINRDDPKVQAAQKACQDVLPQGRPGGPGAGG